MHDIAIIGAGPAGATLALELLKGGLKPVLIDKAIFPRKKVCGGGITIKTFKFLSPNLREVLENEIDQVTLSFALRQSFTKSFPQLLMYTVERKRFDAALVDQVRGAGGVVREGERVEQIASGSGDGFKITTSAATLRARLVVGADGARSLVASCFRLQPVDFFHLGLQVEAPREQVKNISHFSRTIFLDMGSIPDGYAWIFPRGDQVVIGAGGLVHQGKHLKKYLINLLSHLGLKEQQFPLMAHLIPHRITAQPIVQGRVLLVGDAAGLSDYWTGEGICHALASAHFAARHILRYFQGEPGALHDYQVQVDREITPDLIASYQFSKIFNYVGMMAFHILKNHDYPWEVFCRIMRGDRSFVEIKKRFRPDILFRKLLIKTYRNQPNSD